MSDVMYRKRPIPTDLPTSLTIISRFTLSLHEVYFYIESIFAKG